MSDQPNDPQRPDGPPPPPASPQQGAPQPPYGSYPQPGYPAQQDPYATPSGPGAPGQPFPPQPGHPGHGYVQAAQPSPLGGLTDLGFTRRITPGLAKIVYLAVLVLAVISTIVGVLAAIGFFGQALDTYYGGGGLVVTGLIVLVTTPLSAFVVVAFARFLLEYFLDRASAGRSS